MSKRTDTGPILIFLGIAVALIQVVDIIIHAATNQIEPVRVASNLVILGWLAAVYMVKFNARTPRIAALFIGAYLVLNLIFLMVEGVTQNGQVRIVLFLLVFFTVALAALLVYMLGERTKI